MIEMGLVPADYLTSRVALRVSLVAHAWIIVHGQFANPNVLDSNLAVSQTSARPLVPICLIGILLSWEHMHKLVVRHPGTVS
jgi:hypothetical protein